MVEVFPAPLSLASLVKSPQNFPSADVPITQPKLTWQDHSQNFPLRFLLLLQGGLLQHQKSQLWGYLAQAGCARPSGWWQVPFPAGSLMAAMDQQPVALSKAFLHFNPIDRDSCLERELWASRVNSRFLLQIILMGPLLE